MNLFSCLFPCALQHSWWGVENDQCMTEEFVLRMGVNASTAAGVDPAMGLTETSPTVGVLIRYTSFSLVKYSLNDWKNNLYIIYIYIQEILL